MKNRDMQNRTPKKKDTAFPVMRRNEKPGTDADPGLSMPAFSDDGIDDSSLYSNDSVDQYKTDSKETEVGYIEIDLKGNITSCNKTACKILSQPRDVLIGSNYEDHIHEKTTQLINQAFDEINTTKISGKDIDFARIDKDGTKRNLEIYITSTKNADHEPTGFWGIIRDVTKHKQDEETIVKNRRRQDTIFKNAKDVIMTVDSNLKLVEINTASEAICYITPEDGLGKTLADCSTQCNHSCYDVLCEAMKNNLHIKDFHIECKHIRNPLQKRSVSCYSLFSKNSKFLGAILVISKITKNNPLKKDSKDRHWRQSIITKNKRMQEIFKLLNDLADLETTVLITGESGTGKELIARALHHNESSGQKPFVSVSCSALAENLLESELFGHVKGAFTGAIKDSVGRFQSADGGTILLDEIGDISPVIQVKLLRVLQEKEFERVGESITKKVDVRVVACTNRNLKELVEQKRFREDLYYRLKVVEIELPPLRERKEDIPLLTEHFIKTFNKKFNKKISAVSDSVAEILINYSWPGNIRELEHVIERASIFCHKDIIEVEQIPDEIKTIPAENSLSEKRKSSSEPEILIEALIKTGWNKAEAARLLGINRRTLYRKLEIFNISKPEPVL